MGNGLWGTDMYKAETPDRLWEHRDNPLSPSLAASNQYEAGNLFFHIRITHPDGTYSLPPTASPEYPVSDVGPDTNYNLANLRQALAELIEIDGKSGLNNPMLPQWKDFLSNLPDFQYSDTTGYKVSRSIPCIGRATGRQDHPCRGIEREREYMPHPDGHRV